VRLAWKQGFARTRDDLVCCGTVLRPVVASFPGFLESGNEARFAESAYRLPAAVRDAIKAVEDEQVCVLLCTGRNSPFTGAAGLCIATMVAFNVNEWSNGWA